MKSSREFYISKVLITETILGLGLLSQVTRVNTFFGSFRKSQKKYNNVNCLKFIKHCLFVFA